MISCWFYDTIKTIVEIKENERKRTYNTIQYNTIPTGTPCWVYLERKDRKGQPEQNVLLCTGNNPWNTKRELKLDSDSHPVIFQQDLWTQQQREALERIAKHARKSTPQIPLTDTGVVTQLVLKNHFGLTDPQITGLGLYDSDQLKIETSTNGEQ